MPQRIELHRHCACGATWYGAGSPRAIAEVKMLWDQAHSGLGHAVATTREAARARARQEAKARAAEIAAQEVSR